jgi:hypothetical protein
MPLTTATKAFIAQALSGGGKSIMDMTVHELRDMQKNINETFFGDIPTSVTASEKTINNTHLLKNLRQIFIVEKTRPYNF